MSTRWLLSWLILLLAGCAPAPLRSLVAEGPELHPSLVTQKLEDAAILHLSPVLRANPYLSTDAAFADTITRMSSQGRVSEGGVQAALYALYLGEGPLGLYGLETRTEADADRLEGTLREIWAHNGKLGLARVHRQGRFLVVAWHNRVSDPCWEAVNAEVVRRLGSG